MINSFRVRLTAWYVAFFSLLFVLFSVYLYGVLSKALVAHLDETLSVHANTAAALFTDEITEMNGDIAKAAAETVEEMRFQGGAVAIFAENRALAVSASAPEAELAAAVAVAAKEQRANIVTAIERWGKTGARAAIHRVGPSYFVVVAEPLNAVTASLHVARRVIFFGLPFLIGLAALGGYLVASRSLRPLGRMAEQTRQISGDNLHRRLEIGPAADELRMLAESFNELLARLDQSFESMRRFVADASHELRTPISVIRGEADVALARERPPAEYRESLAIILDECRRLSRLVDDLLNLARADGGHVRLDVREFYFNELLADACRSVQAAATARQIELECRCTGDVPFQGDETLLRRLVVNLLDNAVRYTPRHGKVSVSLETEGAELRLRVRDTGVGIAPEEVPRVFERFYRIDKARSREDGGFGLGLSIVKWIAESHRGGVEVSSQPQQGSVFTVTLPR